MDKLEIINNKLIVKNKIKTLTSYQVYLSANQTIMYVKMVLVKFFLGNRQYESLKVLETLKNYRWIFIYEERF